MTLYFHWLFVQFDEGIKRWITKKIGLILIAIIIGIVSAIVFIDGFDGDCHAKAIAASHQLRELSRALDEYKQDHGQYPPDDKAYSSRPLLKYLGEDVSRDEQYYDFTSAMIYEGRYYSLLAHQEGFFNRGFEDKYEIHYRRPVEEGGHMNTDQPNLWTEGCEGDPQGINNFWE